MQQTSGFAPAEQLRSYMIRTGRRYWPRNQSAICRFPVAQASVVAGDDEAVRVELPDWASDLGVGAPRALLVARSCLRSGEGPDHGRCDWWLAAFHHLSGSLERSREKHRGPAHSYAARIGGDSSLFDRAWVNRIFLFLRRAAARHLGQAESALFGALPDAQIVLTHDLDVVGRPFELRAKHAAFQLFNAARLTLDGRPKSAGARLRRMLRLVGSSADLCDFGLLLERTRRHQRQSMLFVYAGKSGIARGLPGMIVDPAYAIDDPKVLGMLSSARREGWVVGLHPSFSSWNKTAMIATERTRLERALQTKVSACRQHWLRFSWEDTWRAQVAAGMRLDMTLGFNDRPGFRNGCALAFSPWNPAAGAPHAIIALPTILMDSQFFDYDLNDTVPVADRIAPWIDEVREVRGVAAVLWHPHTLHPDIGWGAGFDDLLAALGPGGIPAELQLAEGVT